MAYQFVIFTEVFAAAPASVSLQSGGAFPGVIGFKLPAQNGHHSIHFSSRKDRERRSFEGREQAKRQHINRHCNLPSRPSESGNLQDVGIDASVEILNGTERC